MKKLLIEETKNGYLLSFNDGLEENNDIYSYIELQELLEKTKFLLRKEKDNLL